MMKAVLKRVGIGVGLATVLVVAVGLLLPRTYDISRSIVISAPPAQVHALCDDLTQWPRWTPWFKSDPGLEITLGDVTRGPGAHQAWDGRNTRGELTFTRSDPQWGVAFDMVFNGGRTRAACSMRYARVDSGVQVTWDMHGDSGYNVLQRFFGLLMDPLMGPMFDEGLARLKLAAEEEATAPAPATRDLG